VLNDVRLDAGIASLPGSEVDVNFTACLGFTRRARDVHDELMRPSTFGGAARLPQELLQAEDQIGVADVDVQAAVALGSCRNRVAFSLSSRTSTCQEPYSAAMRTYLTLVTGKGFDVDGEVLEVARQLQAEGVSPRLVSFTAHISGKVTQVLVNPDHVVFLSGATGSDLRTA
jgi:hypothetical protein